MQGPLLADYSQSFIEQLRAASSPYSPSTAGARRRLPFAQESHLQRLSMWLSVTFKQRLPWGAAAAQRRRKFMVSILSWNSMLGIVYVCNAASFLLVEIIACMIGSSTCMINVVDYLMTASPHVCGQHLLYGESLIRWYESRRRHFRFHQST